MNLHETKFEILKDYSVDFEMIATMLIGGIEQKTNIRFENVDDIETYNHANDVDYELEDVIFTKSLYRLYTPEFN